MRISKFTGVVTLCVNILVSAASADSYTQNFNFPNGTTDLSDGSRIINNAVIQSGALQLTEFMNAQSGVFNIPAIPNSSLGFTVSFDLVLAANNGPPADGFSFNYGNFSIDENYIQEGVSAIGSLVWIVDTYPNTADDGGYRSKINGITDYNGPDLGMLPNQTLSGPVVISWNPLNGMSFSVAGTSVFANRPTPGFIGDDNYSFGFGASTGGLNEIVRIDNLSIVTVPEPSSFSAAAFAGFCFLKRRRKNQ